MLKGIVVAALLFAAPAAVAAPVTVQVEGSITFLNELIPVGGFGIGTNYTLTLDFDDAAVPLSSTINGTFYPFNAASVAFDTGQTVIGDPANGSIVVANRNQDEIGFGTQQSLGGISFFLRMLDTTAASFATESLTELTSLAQSGDLSRFDVSEFSLSIDLRTSIFGECPTGRSCFFDGNITSISLVTPMAPVPLPAGGALMLAALGGFGTLRLSRRRA